MHLPVRQGRAIAARKLGGRRGWWVVVIVAGLSSLLVGCGGGETTTVTTGDGQPLSRQEFVEQADAICEASNAQSAAVGRPTDLPGFVSTMEQYEAIGNDMVGKLEGLKPPSALRAGFRHLLGEARKLIVLIGMIKAAAQAGDREGMLSAAQRGDALNRTANSDARALGLGVCAENQPPA